MRSIPTFLNTPATALTMLVAFLFSVFCFAAPVYADVNFGQSDCPATAEISRLIHEVEAHQPHFLLQGGLPYASDNVLFNQVVVLGLKAQRVIDYAKTDDSHTDEALEQYRQAIGVVLCKLEHSDPSFSE